MRPTNNGTSSTTTQTLDDPPAICTAPTRNPMIEVKKDIAIAVIFQRLRHRIKTNASTTISARAIVSARDGHARTCQSTSPANSAENKSQISQRLEELYENSCTSDKSVQTLRED